MSCFFLYLDFLCSFFAKWDVCSSPIMLTFILSFSQIEATNTCGEKLINDATGRPYPAYKVDNFRTFYRQTGASGATRYRDHCDNESRDPSKRHPPQNMVDLDCK